MNLNLNSQSSSLARVGVTFHSPFALPRTDFCASCQPPGQLDAYSSTRDSVRPTACNCRGLSLLHTECLPSWRPDLGEQTPRTSIKGRTAGCRAKRETRPVCLSWKCGATLNRASTKPTPNQALTKTAPTLSSGNKMDSNRSPSHHQEQDQRQKTALVTGSSNGIGEAIVKQLAKLDYKLVVTGRNLDDIARVAQECARLSPSRSKVSSVPAVVRQPQVAQLRPSQPD